MALSRIGANAAEATTITIPASHQAGDLIIIFAFRTATTAPSLPAGWTSLSTASAGASSFTLGYKLAISNADTSGTWTNATGLVCHVYRGLATNKTPIGASTNTTATSATVTYGALNLQCPGTSWLVAFGATKTAASSLETPPTSMTNAATAVGAATEYAGHDTNGVYTVGAGAWPSTNVSVGTSAEYRTCVVEIFAEQLNLNNYLGFDVGDGMSTGEKIR